MANVVKLTDNIVKTFATTFSTVISFFVTSWFTGDSPEVGLLFAIGTIIIITSPYLYLNEERKLRESQALYRRIQQVV